MEDWCAEADGYSWRFNIPIHLKPLQQEGIQENRSTCLPFQRPRWTRRSQYHLIRHPDFIDSAKNPGALTVWTVHSPVTHGSPSV